MVFYLPALFSRGHKGRSLSSKPITRVHSVHKHSTPRQAPASWNMNYTTITRMTSIEWDVRNLGRAESASHQPFFLGKPSHDYNRPAVAFS